MIHTGDYMERDKTPSNESLQQLFPLPLTSMERFHLLDNSDDAPNYIYCRLEFAGTIQAEHAEQALRSTIQRHPIMGSEIKNKDGKLAWHWNPELRKPIDWQELATDSVDLPELTDSLWRVVARQRDNKTTFWMYGIHVLSDGIGAISFVTDWLKIYHNLCADQPATHRLRKLDQNLLKHRGNLGLLKGSYLKHLWKQPLGFYGALKFVFRKAAVFSASSNKKAWDYKTQPVVIGDWIDAKATEQLTAEAQRRNVSLHSLLLGHYFVHLHHWCQTYHSDQTKKWIRVIHPFNIRDYADRRMTTTNRAAIVQIDRRDKDFDDFQGLVENLDREVSVIHRWQLSKLFLISIRMMSAIPGMLRRSATDKKSRGTSVFTNLSESFGRAGFAVENESLVVGNLQMTAFDLVGPVREGTPVNMTVQRHLGKLRLSLHADPQVLTGEKPKEFLAAYSNRLKASVLE